MPSSFEDEQAILARFTEEVDEALANPESAYNTIADLPVDQELIDVIEEFAEASITVCQATLLTPRIKGLPEAAVRQWGSPDNYLLVPHEDGTLSEEQLWNSDVQVLFTDDSKRKDILDAYELVFEGGVEERAGSTPMILFQMTNNTTGNILRIRRADITDASSTADPFALYDGNGVHLANLTQANVFELLGSMANDRLAVDSTADPLTQFKQYIYYLGERFGVSRKEHHLTGSLLPSDEEQDSYVYGGVIFAEQETPVNSSRSFVIERLQKCADRNTDTVHKMRAEYANAPMPVHPQDTQDGMPRTPELEKITCKPARYIIKSLSFDKEVHGTSTPLPIGPSEVEMLNDTLQQVVASVCDRFTPERP